MTIEERIERLERQNRRLRSASWTCALALLAGIALGFTRQGGVPDLVKAHAFHVVGKNGKVLLKLEDTFGLSAGFAGTITILNAKGKNIVELGATVRGGLIRTQTHKGQDLVRLGATMDGEGVVTTLNGKGQNLVELGTTADGNGTVATLNVKGQSLVRLGAGADGTGMVTVHDPSGRTRDGQLNTRQ